MRTVPYSRRFSPDLMPAARRGSPQIARRALALVLSGVVILSGRTAAAQGLISAGVGGGSGFGNHNRESATDGAHGLGYVQLHPPLFPLAVRVDALVTKAPVQGTTLSVLGDVVFVAPLPVVHPYALVGYGRYGVGKEGSEAGWSAGAGIRLRMPSVSVFAEARRHQRIRRDLFTIGLSL